MAKLKINEGGIKMEAKIPEGFNKPIESLPERPELDLSPINEQIRKNTEEIKNLSDKDEIILKQISRNKKALDNLIAKNNQLITKVQELEKPIVKEIKIDKTNSDDLDHLEQGIKKTTDKMFSELKLENATLAKAFMVGNRVQSAINFLLIIGLALVVIFK